MRSVLRVVLALLALAITVTWFAWFPVRDPIPWGVSGFLVLCAAAVVRCMAVVRRFGVVMLEVGWSLLALTTLTVLLNSLTVTPTAVERATTLLLVGGLMAMAIGLCRTMSRVHANIEEHRATEDALRLSERQARGYFDLPLVGVAAAAPDGRFLDVNAHACAMTGYSREELLSMTVAQVTHPECLGQDEALTQQMESGAIDCYSVEKQYVRKDGSTIDAHASIGCIRGDDGRVERYVGVIHDMTERKRAEHALRESEERYRTLFESAPCGFLIVDSRGRILDVNPDVCAMLGYRREELIGCNVSRLSELDTPTIRRHVEEVLRGGEKQHQVVHWTREGHRREVELRETRIRLPDGEDGVLVLSRDVTEHNRAQAALRAGEQRYRSLVSALAVGVLLMDCDGVIRACNDSASRILGLPRHQILGRANLDPRWRSIREDGTALPAEQRPSEITRLTGKPCEQQVMGIHKPDGAVTWLSVNCRPLEGESGDGAHGVVVSFTDITELRNATRALRESEHRYRGLAERLQVMFDELDHRVKNNLAALYSLVDMYAEAVTDADQFAAAMRGKLRAMKTAHEFIAAAGWSSVEMHPLVRCLAEHAAAPGDGANRVRVEGPALRIAARQAAPLAMVFQELFTNAAKHGAFRAAGGSVEVRWRQSERPDGLRGVTIAWRETTSDSPDRPESEGLGLELIKGFARFELNGSVEFRFESTGFCCELCCGLDPVAEPTGEHVNPATACP